MPGQSSKLDTKCIRSGGLCLAVPVRSMRIDGTAQALGASPPTLRARKSVCMESSTSWPP